MANNIKGITIEIGATTTKLDKALKDVNSKARSLSGELKQIDRQLKFNPNSVGLLKQKFDVLTSEVENTRQKLKALEDAQNQVTRQYQKGEIDEGQYRAFQRELEQTKNYLQYLEEEQEKAGALFDTPLGEQYVELQDKIADTQSHLADLEAQQSDVEAAFQNGDLGEDEYQAFQDELSATQDELNNLQSAASDLEGELSSAADEANSTGDAFSQMGDDASAAADDVSNSFDPSILNFAGITESVENVGGIIQNAIDKAKELGSSIAGIITGYYDHVDEINTNAKKFDISTDLYQGLEYAEPIIDVSVENIGNSFQKLTKKMDQARDGNKTAKESFEKLGIAIYDDNGYLRDAEDVFYDVIDALHGMDDETERNITAGDLLGRSYQNLNPLIHDGADELRGLVKESKDMGAIIEPDELETMQQTKDTLDRLHYQLANALAPVIEAISPYIEQVAQWLAEKLADPKVQETIGRIAEAIGKMAEAIADSIMDFVESGKAEELIDALIDFLPVITDFIKNTLPPLLEALGKIMEFFTGILSPMDTFDTKMDNLSDGIDTFGSEGEAAGGLIKKAFTEGFGAIGDVIEKTMDEGGVDIDDLKKEADKKVPGIGTLFESTFNGITTDINEAFFGAGGAWASASGFFDNITKSFGGLPSDVQSLLSSFPSTVASIFNDSEQRIKLFDTIKEEFQNIPQKIGSWLSGMGRAIGDAFKKIRMPKPHWKGGNLNKFPPDFGHIEWYKEGGIFSRPTVIGVGEAGTEAVLPLDKLGQMLNSTGRSGSVIINAPVQVVKELNDAELNRVGNRITNIVGRQFAKRTGGVM